MIRNKKTFRMFEGDTCHLFEKKAGVFDYTQVILSKDAAWEIVKSLLSDLQYSEEDLLELRFFEEITE